MSGSRKMRLATGIVRVAQAGTEILTHATQ